MKTAFITSAIVVCLIGHTSASTPVRVATWNIEGVGLPGSIEYDAALLTLLRLDADVVGIQEVASAADASNFAQLAIDAGYGFTAVPGSNPFGAVRCAVLSRFEIVRETFHDSPTLSGDPVANDISRFLVEVVLDVPGEPEDLTLVVNHWKSGTANADEFRRALESYRIDQATAGLATDDDHFVVLGDMNEEIDNVPQTPDPFVVEPTGLPASFDLGVDLEAVLVGPGLRNDPFFYLDQVVAVAALQLDGSDGTRPASGRRLDYLFTSRALERYGVEAEVYDSIDEGLPGGLPKAGSPPPPSTSDLAADHLPVFMDILVAEAGPFDILRYLAKADIPGFPEKTYLANRLPFADPDPVLTPPTTYLYQAVAHIAPIYLVKTIDSIAIY